MELLSGDLGDFAIADMLRILALSQKTGLLSLEAAYFAGKIYLEQGRIVYAWSAASENLSEVLARARAGQAPVTQASDNGATAVVPLHDVEWIASQHFRVIVASLLARDKGSFRFDLDQQLENIPPGEIRLSEGLNVFDFLSHQNQTAENAEEAAASETEASETDDASFAAARLALSESIADLLPKEETSFLDARPSAVSSPPVADLLYSCLAEMRALSFEAEVSLLVMRYVSEIMARGMLLGVFHHELRGLGQFGFKSASHVDVDAEVRSLRLPLRRDSILSHVIASNLPYVGPMFEESWQRTLLSRLGCSLHECPGLLFPVCCEGKTSFIVYGDNYPDNREVSGLSELMILTDQASLMMDKLRLEKILAGQSAAV